jgi:nucleotide-binding universal stress UspA family protein
MKVLLAVDGSPYTQRMLTYIADNPALLGHTHHYTVFTAVTSYPAHVRAMFNAETLASSYRDAAEAILNTVKAFASQQDWTVDMRHAAGYPPDVIADFAKAEKFDLIVMGTHGQSALSNLVLGSVVNGVLARCETPVLLVR